MDDRPRGSARAGPASVWPSELPRARRALAAPRAGTHRACPDEGRDDPQMAPVQRIDDRAVEDQAAPGAEQRRRPNPVGVPADDDVSQRENERGEQKRDPYQQPERPLLG